MARRRRAEVVVGGEVVAEVEVEAVREEPLEAPGTNIRPGDAVVMVEGRPLVVSRPVPCHACGGGGESEPGEACPLCSGFGSFFSPALRSTLETVLARRCGGSAFAYGAADSPHYGQLAHFTPEVEAELHEAMAALAEHVDGLKHVRGVRCYSFPGGEAAEYVEALLVAGRPVPPRHVASLHLPPEVLMWFSAIGGEHPARVRPLREVVDELKGDRLPVAYLVSSAALVRGDDEARAFRSHVLGRGGSFVTLPADVAERWPLGLAAVVPEGV